MWSYGTGLLLGSGIKTRHRGVRSAAALFFALSAFSILLVAQASATPSSDEPTAGPAPKEAPRVPNGYIIVFKDSVDHPGGLARAQVVQHHGKLGFIYHSAIEGYSAELSDQAVEALRRHPLVKHVTPDYKVELDAQTTPDGIKRTLAASNPELDIDGHDDVRVDADVAVIDSGIAEHPDLNIAGRTDCVAAGENPETSNSVCTNESGTDKNGHGTHVAGTVGAIDNGFGVVGVAPGVRLWSVRAFNANGNANISWILAGVDWVAARASEIEVVNMSFTCGCISTPLEEAIEESGIKGIVNVAAAGNEGINANTYSPARNLAVITVSAVEDTDGMPGGTGPLGCEAEDDVLAQFSNYGSTVEIAAPGVCVYSTLPKTELNSGYGVMSGTSMAAPHVAGAAAILAAADNPQIWQDVEEIRDTLIENGSYEWTDNSGDGIKEPLLDVGLISTDVPTISSSSKAILRGRVNPRGVSTTYRFEYGPTRAYGTTVPISGESAGSGSNYASVSRTIEGLSSGKIYHYRLSATNSKGTIYGADRTFATTSPAATTLAATRVGRSGGTGVNNFAATLNGVAQIKEERMSYVFEYGKTTSYGSTAAQSVERTKIRNGPALVSERIVGLEPGTTYHYRVVAQGRNAEGKVTESVVGSDRTLTTDASLGVEFSFDASVPRDVATDPDGNAWILSGSFGDMRIQKVSPEGELLARAGSQGFGEGQYDVPLSLATDSAGNLWVADIGGYCQILKFDSAGRYLKTVDIAALENEETEVTPCPIHQLAVASDGSFWGLNIEQKSFDPEGPPIRKFNAQGEVVAELGSFGSGNGQFSDPTDITIDGSGNLWVTDEHRIQKFKSTGEFLLKFGTSGSGNGQFSAAESTAFDSAGAIWVTDSGNDRLQKFNSKGEYLAKFGSAGQSVGQFSDPRGTAVDAAGNIWIADSANDRFVKVMRPPTAETAAATSIKGTQATLNGSVTSGSFDTTYFFEYGKTTSYGKSAPIDPKAVSAGISPSAVSETITGLELNTTYHYRLGTTNGSETHYGNDLTFVTGDTSTPPSVKNSGASEVHTVQYGNGGIATLKGTVNPKGGKTTYQFELSTTWDYYEKTIPIPAAALNGTSDQPYQVQIAATGLNTGVKYHYRIKATNSGGTGYSEDKTFWVPYQAWTINDEPFEGQFYTEEYEGTFKLANEKASDFRCTARFILQPEPEESAIAHILDFEFLMNTCEGESGCEISSYTESFSGLEIDMSVVPEGLVIENGGPVPYTVTSKNAWQCLAVKNWINIIEVSQLDLIPTLDSNGSMLSFELKGYGNSTWNHGTFTRTEKYSFFGGLGLE